MKYRLKVYSIWEFGQRKDSHGNPHQEDSIYPEFGKQSDSDRLFILCDGMGGHEAGEVASSTVCEAMSHAVLNDKNDEEGVFTAEDFESALKAAFKALDSKDNGAEKKMGTTLTFLKLHKNGATIAHIGDSRVYHIRPGQTGTETQILFETEDHSLVNDLIKVGELTREEARMSKQKNVITRAMQPNMGRPPKADLYTTKDIKPGDYFYMCSDGMLEQPEMEDGTSLRNIFSAMGGDDENKLEILRSVTEKNRDNHTAFIVHIIDVIDPAPEEPSVQGDNKREAGDKFVAIVEDADIIQTKDSNSEVKANCDKVRKVNTFRFRGNKRAWILSLVVAVCMLAAVIIFLCIKLGTVKTKSKAKENEPPFIQEVVEDGPIKEAPLNTEFVSAKTRPNPPVVRKSKEHNTKHDSKPDHTVSPAEDQEENVTHSEIVIEEENVVDSNEQIIIDNLKKKKKKENDH